MAVGVSAKSRSGPAAAVVRAFALACLWIGVACGAAGAEPPPRSVLVLDQSETTSPFYFAIFSGVRSIVTASRGPPVSVYLESVDLDRFRGPVYEASLTSHMRVKYRGRPPGVLVAVGARSLEFALRLRPQLWPDVPIVFCLVDEATLEQLNLGPRVTGNTLRLHLSDMMTVARALVPNLKHVAVVGDAWKGQTVFQNFENEMPAATAGVDLIDLVGLSLAQVRTRVAALPRDAAILYTAMYSDGAGASLLASEALARFADVANAPIVGAAETFVGAGATGGVVMAPAAIGEAAGRLAVRILAGEDASRIPGAAVDAMRPVFDARQLERWGVKEASLPGDSKILFRDQGAWERYRWQMIGIAAVTLFQATLIAALLYQRWRRRTAESEARARMAQLAHMNRRTTVGQLTASIAHELNQPLGAILNNAEAAAMLIDAPSLNREELRAILADIKRDDRRASEVIKRLRRLLARGAAERRVLDLNEVVREVFTILTPQAGALDVTLVSRLESGPLWVEGDSVQLEQVILNLVINGVEALAAAPNGVREVSCRSWEADGRALVSIRDSGAGIEPEQRERLFEPFSTTKTSGMGMGLYIARTIIEAHGGTITAESRSRGAVFHISLPLARRAEV